jgi:hypothetical protein
MPTGDIIHRRVNLASTTIRQLKELLATDTIPASRMRLVRGGQVLQDETDTLEKYRKYIHIHILVIVAGYHLCYP